jgi:threonine/homoserine/homoserine lactone efflux protein
MPSTLLAFLGACTLIAASPGPSTVLIIKESLRSRRAGFPTVLGNETGVFVRGAVAALGLTALPAASELAYDVMRIVGAVVLVVCGVQTLWQARRATRRRVWGWRPGRAAGPRTGAGCCSTSPTPRRRPSPRRSCRSSCPRARPTCPGGTAHA